MWNWVLLARTPHAALGKRDITKEGGEERDKIIRNIRKLERAHGALLHKEWPQDKKRTSPRTRSFKLNKSQVF